MARKKPPPKDTAVIENIGDRRDRQQKIDRLVSEISTLGQVFLPDQDSGALRDYSSTFQQIQDNIAILGRTQARLLVRVKSLKAEVAGLTAEIKIKLDELLITDSEVKSRPNERARLSMARWKLGKEFATLNERKVDLATYDGLLDVCKMVEKRLITAKETLGHMTRVIEMSMVTDGRMPTVRLGRSGLSSS